MLSALSVTAYARLPRAACFDVLGRPTPDIGVVRECVPVMEPERPDVAFDRAA